jgi:hypothetical protein
MSQPQARGYIKARAGLLVERRLQEAVGRSMSAARYARLEGFALEALCQLVQMEIAAPKLAPAVVRKAA